MASTLGKKTTEVKDIKAIPQAQKGLGIGNGKAAELKLLTAAAPSDSGALTTQPDDTRIVATKSAALNSGTNGDPRNGK